MSQSKQMPDTLLLVDIASSCWEKPVDQPAGQENEIIEIGAVPISIKNLTIGEPKNWLIKPIKSKISKFCTRITTITQEQVDAGVSFEDACKGLIKDMDAQKIPWISWGDFDRRMFMMQCEKFQVNYPFGAGHWNFKETFAKFMGLEHDVGLPIALKLLGIEFIGIHHRPAWDVMNIGRLIQEVMGRARGISKSLVVPEETRPKTGVEYWNGRPGIPMPIKSSALKP